MIVRRWTARAGVAGARGYLEFFRDTLEPALAHLDGHAGALVLDRVRGDDDVELTVLTFWDSMEAVAAFAGADPTRAVVEPDAQALLRDFDATVEHLTLQLDSLR